MAKGYRCPFKKHKNIEFVTFARVLFNAQFHITFWTVLIFKKELIIETFLWNILLCFPFKNYR